MRTVTVVSILFIKDPSDIKDGDSGIGYPYSLFSHVPSPADQQRFVAAYVPLNLDGNSIHHNVKVGTFLYGLQCDVARKGYPVGIKSYPVRCSDDFDASLGTCSLLCLERHDGVRLPQSILPDGSGVPPSYIILDGYTVEVQAEIPLNPRLDSYTWFNPADIGRAYREFVEGQN